MIEGRLIYKRNSKIYSTIVMNHGIVSRLAEVSNDTWIDGSSDALFKTKFYWLCANFLDSKRILVFLPDSRPAFSYSYHIVYYQRPAQI